jgi:tetratricopeptide (TPR) repeat protein
MNNNSSHAEDEVEATFQERIDILFHELELAVKWDRPSILFAIYKSETVRDEVNTLLGDKLSSLSQKIQRIRTDSFDFMAEIAGLPNLSQTVLLIEGFKWDCGQEGLSVLTEFNKHRDYFVDNHIRAIFWLYEQELSEFTQDATECWILRQRVVDFVDLPHQLAPQQPAPQQPAPQPTQPLESFWQEAGESMPGGELSDESFTHIVDLAKKNQANAEHANRLLSQGILGWRKGNSQAALKYLRVAAGIARVIGNHALQSQCQNAIALTNAELGNEEDAISAYENAANLAPKSGYLWNNLGQLLARKERNEEAITAFKKAVETTPQDFIGWDGLGHVYLKMGLHQNAISAFEKAIEISPTYELSWSGLGQAYLESGQLEKATIPLGKAVKLNPHAIEAWRNLGKCFTQLERERDAISVLQQALESNPEAAILWKELGGLYLHTQDYVESISALQKAVSLCPKCPLVKIDLACAHFKMGDYDTAAEVYEETIVLCDDPGKRSGLLNQLGDTYMHLKEYEKAIAAYEQADHAKVEGRETISDEEISIPSVNVVDEEIDEVEVEKLPRLDASKPVKVMDESIVEETVVEEKPARQEACKPVMEKEQKKEQAANKPVDKRGEKMNEANQVFDTRTATEWNELGNTHLKQGAFNDAIVAYTRAIELSQGTSWPYIKNLAQVHYKKGKAKGKQALDQVDDDDLLDLNEDDPSLAEIFDQDAIPNPERAHSEDGTSQLATQAGNASMVAGSGDQSTSNPADNETASAGEGAASLSSEQQVAGQPSPSIPVALPAVLDEPRNSIDWNDRGNNLTRAKKYDEAIQAYKKALELNPRYGQPYSNMGLIYYHLGRFDSAILLFKKSLALLETREDKAAAWNKLGDCHRRMGDYGNALNAYQKSSELTSTSRSTVTRSRVTLFESAVVG